MFTLPKSRKKHHGSRHGLAIQRLAQSGGLNADPAWPLLACYGPRPEVWQVSGFGTIFIARRKPNREEVWALAVISLSEGGITTVGGRRAAPPGEHEQWCRELGDLALFPASTELPEAVVADYLYGACALRYGDLLESQWPREAREVAGLLRHPPGGPAEWRDRLTGPTGMTPAGLVAVVRGHGHTAEIPDGKDPLVGTTARVSLRDGTAEDVTGRLLSRQTEPLFVDMGKRGSASVLEWVKPYTSGQQVPARHKFSAVYEDKANPNQGTFRILTDAGHQGMGQIVICDDIVEVEALTLSRASVLMGALLDATDSAVVIESAEWDPIVPPGSRSMR